MRNISEYLVNESLYKTISLEELINAILKGKDYPAGTKIVFDKSVLNKIRILIKTLTFSK